MKTIARHLGAALMSRGPQRGTLGHMIGSIAAGVLMGVVFYLVRANS